MAATGQIVAQVDALGALLSGARQSTTRPRTAAEALAVRRRTARRRARVYALLLAPELRQRHDEERSRLPTGSGYACARAFELR